MDRLETVDCFGKHLHMHLSDIEIYGISKLFKLNVISMPFESYGSQQQSSERRQLKLNGITDTE